MPGILLHELLTPPEQLYYSAVSGWNRYRETGERYPWADGDEYLTAENLPAGETFHLRPFSGDFDTDTYAHLTANPAPQCFVWPVDAVTRPKGEPAYRLVFRNLPLPKQGSLAEFIDRRNTVEEPEDSVRALQYARQIVRDAADFYGCGYAYYGWQAEVIYIAENGGLCYDYTGTAAPVQPEMPFPDSGRMKRSCDPLQTQYGADLDFFALAVLLFYVLVGRYPYDGRMMDGISAAAGQEQDWFEAYRKNCVFIFDPDDQRNCVGTFAHEAKYHQRWNSLPQDVQQVFLQTFRRNPGQPFEPAVSPAKLLETCEFFRGE